MNDILRRKLRRSTEGPEDLASELVWRQVDFAWRQAVLRALRDSHGLQAEVVGIDRAERSLAELVEILPEPGLYALIDAPGGATGLIALSADLVSGLIEMMTTGRVAEAPPLPRRPTRTDAAMLADMIDLALMRCEAALAGNAATALAGMRFASHLEEGRLLPMLFDDQYIWQVTVMQLSLAEGARQAAVLLALPPVSQRHGQSVSGQIPEDAGDDPGLAAVISGAECRIEAVLTRLHLPLAQLMALRPDDLLPLGGASLDQVSLEGPDGCRLALARLGQSRGMRALRLMSESAGAEGGDAAPETMTGGGEAEPLSGLPLPSAGYEAGFNTGYAVGADMIGDNMGGEAGLALSSSADPMAGAADLWPAAAGESQTEDYDFNAGALGLAL